MCGVTVSDCSCDKSCMSLGTCCSDYQGCQTLVVNTPQIDNCRSIQNCLLCNTINNTCGQCETNYYLLNGKCVSSCGQTGVTVFTATKTCYETQGNINN